MRGQTMRTPARCPAETAAHRRVTFEHRIQLAMFANVPGGLPLVWSPGAHGEASFGQVPVAVACLCRDIDDNLTRKDSVSDAVLVAGLNGLVAGASFSSCLRSATLAPHAPGPVPPWPRSLGPHWRS